ncbi:MAG: L-lactate permease [Varibaculum sp.]|nr:L-lactate permease [Varibaculum sp.]
MTYTPAVDALAGSLPLTALAAAVPIVVFFLLVGVLQLRSHVSGAFALAAALIVAVAAFKMPVQMALSGMLLGFTFGLLPIGLIVLAAVWLHNLMTATGRERDLTAIFDRVSRGDIRVETLLIALCFGGLLEGLAGFGVPVAILTVLLINLGLEPHKAAIIALVANTSPVAYAAFGVPITTAGSLLGGADKSANAAEIAVQVSTLEPWIALVMPFVLLWLIDRHSFGQLFVLAAGMGVSEAAGQFLTIRYVSFELAGVLPAIVTFGVAMGLLALHHPQPPTEYARARHAHLHPGRSAMAILPYALVIAILAGGRMIPPLRDTLAATDLHITWPGLEGLTGPGGADAAATHVILPTLSQPGVLIAIAAVISAVVFSLADAGGRYPLGARAVAGAAVETWHKMRLAVLTIVEVIGLAYVMNLSGEVLAIGTLLAATGGAFVFLSPVIGWLGTAISGSATSANALFTGLQDATAIQVGMSGTYAVALNTAGGVIGKLVAPQSLAIGAAAMGEPEKETWLLRRVLGVSILLLVYIIAVGALVNLLH